MKLLQISPATDFPSHLPNQPFSPGSNIPASCIQSRMKMLRKKSAELGITPQDSPTKTPNKRAGPAAEKSSAKKSKGKKGAQSGATANNDDDDVEEASTQPNNLKHPATPSLSSDENHLANDTNENNQTPQPKRKIAKPRASRRKSVKPKEPLIEETLENGGVEMVFVKSEVKDEEDTEGEDKAGISTFGS